MAASETSDKHSTLRGALRIEVELAQIIYLYQYADKNLSNSSPATRQQRSWPHFAFIALFLWAKHWRLEEVSLLTGRLHSFTLLFLNVHRKHDLSLEAPREPLSIIFQSVAHVLYVLPLASQIFFKCTRSKSHSRRSPRQLNKSQLALMVLTQWTLGNVFLMLTLVPLVYIFWELLRPTGRT